MNNKKIILGLVGIITAILLVVFCISSKEASVPQDVYQVYLDGEKIGLIYDQEELLNLINEEQNDIKEQYSVDNVYPPEGFEITSYTTYDEKISSAEQIYQIIKEKSDFTIEGYIVTLNMPIDSVEEDGEIEKIYLQVLDEEIFKSALENVVTAFVDEEVYLNYINNTQVEIETTGEYITYMYFEEVITIKEANISVNSTIYTSVSELSQYLLFGTTEASSTYTVQVGDTIETISEENELNTSEFLIANPQYRSKDSLLTVGAVVNVSLIDPILSLIQSVYIVEDVEVVYEKTEVIDSTKSSSYSEVTQEGVTGINRVSQNVRIVNGVMDQGVEVVATQTLVEKVDQITTVGTKSTGTSTISGTYVDTGLSWGWPTNQPYVITSEYGWRSGSYHTGLDISGTGKNSPIYAAKEGTVVNNSGCGDWSYGNCVIIAHENNYYTLYAHMNYVSVSVGQVVSRGEVIGGMGETGQATGVHLHFSFSIGYPNSGGTFYTPWSLYQ